MVVALYSCSQAVLADVCRFAWLLCLQFLSFFANYKSKYTAAFVNENLALITAFSLLSNYKTSSESIQKARALYLGERDAVFTLFKYLKGYITDITTDKARREILCKEAGQLLYDNLKPNDWTDLDGLLTAMISFVRTNQAELVEKGGMPLHFVTRLDEKPASLEVSHKAWIAENENASKAAEAKTVAGNELKARVMAMLEDAKIIFDSDKSIAKKFVWDTIVDQIRGVKDAGIGGKINILGAKKTIPNVTVTIASLNLSVVSDADGRYALSPIPEGDYDIEFKAEGYKTLVVASRSIKTGVVGRLNVELEANIS